MVNSIKERSKNPLDEIWPIDELEEVSACPYCESGARKLAYEDVQDWSFQSAPGKWKYWDCQNCGCLYLSPRPTERSVGLAYSNYYTHNTLRSRVVYAAIRERLKNDWISSLLGFSFTPRFYIPRFVVRMAAFLANKTSIPFGLGELKNRKRGNLLDFGCGSGFYLYLAQQLGWNAMGIDADPLAVESARRRGVNVIQGSYEVLKEYPRYFDCVICSHVLEHMYHPLELLRAVAGSIRNDGALLLSLPNSTSALRKHFGSDWRGLEAPRHISIPSQSELVKILKSLGFSVESCGDTELGNVVECFRIRRRSLAVKSIDVASAKNLLLNQSLPESNANDFTKLTCTKRHEVDSVFSC